MSERLSRARKEYHISDARVTGAVLRSAHTADFSGHTVLCQFRVSHSFKGQKPLSLVSIPLSAVQSRALAKKLNVPRLSPGFINSAAVLRAHRPGLRVLRSACSTPTLTTSNDTKRGVLTIPAGGKIELLVLVYLAQMGQLNRRSARFMRFLEMVGMIVPNQKQRVPRLMVV